MSKIAGLPFETILSAISNALDAGISHWCRPRSLEYELPENFDLTAIPWITAGEWIGLERYLAPLVPNGSLSWVERDDGLKCVLDLEAVERGLNLMREKYPRHYNDLANGDDDAITADVFVQCAVLGKIVYG